MKVNNTYGLPYLLYIKNSSVREEFFVSQIIRKPGSVLANHLSRSSVTTGLKRFIDNVAGGPIVVSLQ